LNHFNSTTDLECDATTTPIQIINKNNFAFNSMYTLPIGSQMTKIKYSKDVPIIGSLANLLGLGNFDLSKRDYKFNSPINEMVECNVSEMLSNITKAMIGGETDDYFLSAFAGQDEGFKIFSPSAINTTFAFALSDRIYSSKVDSNGSHI
jgi:hypothetical protein